MNSIQNQIRAYEKDIIKNAELVKLIDQEVNEVNEKEADEKEADEKENKES